VSNKNSRFWGGFYRVGSWESFVVHKISRPLQSLPPVFLFCIANYSTCGIRVCVEWELFLFGWHWPGRFMRVFRFPQNLKSVSIAPSRFVVLHSELFYLWYKGLCRMKSLVFRNCSLIRAGVGHLVLHREPFFILTKGLRFQFRLKNIGHDAPLTIHPKPLKL